MTNSPNYLEMKTLLSTDDRLIVSPESQLFKSSTIDLPPTYTVRKAQEILNKEIEADLAFGLDSNSENDKVEQEYWRPSWSIADMYKDIEEEDLEPRAYNRRLLIDYTVFNYKDGERNHSI